MSSTSPAPVRLACLISGGGTTMTNLSAHIADGRLNAKIVHVQASNDKAGGIPKAAALGLQCPVVARKNFESTEAFSDAVFASVRASGAELVCLCGYLSLLKIPPDFAGRVINIHPALLPAFGGKGMHGRHVHEAVLAHGCKISGCTVHFADDTYDTGKILVQRACPVLTGDTPETLAARVFEQECLAYPEAIQAWRAARA